jgi:hypothetical protein
LAASCITITVTVTINQSGGPGSQSCATQAPPATSAQTIQAQVDGAGWPDRGSPNAEVAHPEVHQTAGGDGTYCNPTSFATADVNDGVMPYGTLIYVPGVKRYFVREDDCEAAVPNGPAPCSGQWFVLWVGGTAADDPNAVQDCERKITAQQDVIINPSANLPVNAGPIFKDGVCNP